MLIFNYWAHTHNYELFFRESASVLTGEVLLLAVVFLRMVAEVQDE